MTSHNELTRDALAQLIYDTQHPDNGSRWLTTVDGSPNVCSYGAADAVLAAGYHAASGTADLDTVIRRLGGIIYGPMWDRWAADGADVSVERNVILGVIQERHRVHIQGAAALNSLELGSVILDPAGLAWQTMASSDGVNWWDAAGQDEDVSSADLIAHVAACGYPDPAFSVVHFGPPIARGLPTPKKI